MQGCVLSPLLFNIFLSDLPDIFNYECDPIKLNDVTISCLMFADDLVLMSESAFGLQKCLSHLEEYCNTWGLTINISKTKIVIFNKGGHSISRHKSFIYDNQIEIVQKYCYLGIVFSSSGSFKNACNVLYDKALKALYMLKQIQPHNNVKLALNLFDTLIFPILSYGGVVWGPLYAQKANLTNLFNVCNDSSIEKLNVKMCKYLLGVHRKSTNDAVIRQLVRFLILINILNHSYRYYNRIENISVPSLVKHSCLDKDLWSLSSSWYCSMKRLITLFNQSRSFLCDMQNIYRNSWREKINSCTGKLRTYSKFKKEFKLENYIVQFPLYVRRNLSKLRISAHNLAIETGRYIKVKAAKTQVIDKRLCLYCKQIESEFHLIFECHLYDSIRTHFF